MSYLEQLKKEAQARQKQEHAEALENKQQQAQREQRFRRQVKPALERLRSYLCEMIEQLNYLKPNTKASYQLTGYDKWIEDFKQQKYRVILLDELEAIKNTFNIYPHMTAKRNDIDTRSNFVLRCQCQAPYKLRLKMYKKREAALQQAYFLKHNIRFTYEEEMDANIHFAAALFIVELVIFVEFEFVGCFETSTIDLTVTNFNELGKRFYTLQPKEINHQWLDELAKYILREPNHLQLREKTSGMTPTKHRPKSSAQEASKAPRQKRVVAAQQSSSITADVDEFDEWIRSQEQQLAATTEKATEKKKGFLGIFKKST